MIGKIYVSLFPFYDSERRRNSFKQRPVLIISEKRNGDYTVLPISTIGNPANRDPVYDISVTLSEYPLLNLEDDSFVRTHKQSIVHRGSLVKLLSDLPSVYPELYMTILAEWESYTASLIQSAILLL